MHHLNLCRQLTKQASERRSVPGLGESEKARLAHAIDLCRASQKFLLPDGGQLFGDDELRALDESERLRLPHPFIAIEYLAGKQPSDQDDDTDLSEQATKRIVFAREFEEGIEVSPAVCFDADGLWHLMESCFLPATYYLIRSNNKNDRPKINLMKPRDQDIRDYVDEVSALLKFLNALQCSNVHIEKTLPRNASRKVKAALPFDAYHILTIDVPGRDQAKGPGLQCQHRSPREHLRRGHIVRPEGRRPFWRNATVVNPGVGGKVTKDYALRQRVDVSRSAGPPSVTSTRDKIALASR